MQAGAAAPEPLSSAAMLARLVGFDTTSRNSNRALIDFVRGWLEGWGVPCRMSVSPAGDKANLHAILGPAGAGGVALSGHVDTVPVDGQAWSGDPFTLRAREGRLLARGATDMKGFVACCLAAVPAALAAGLRAPLHLFITYDEEVGMYGARRLVEDLGESGLKPALCIVGEPTLMQPTIAHKGKLSVDVAVRGRSGHSSQPGRGVNAVFAAAEAVAWIAAEARRLAAEGPFAEGFDPPHTTVHVGTLAGGTILNIIPEHARFSMEWRAVPGDDAQAMLARLRAHVETAIVPAMRAVDPGCGFAFAVANVIPPLALAPDHALVDLVCALSGVNGLGRVSYATEAGIFQEAGIAAIVCGPGSITDAHQPDEGIAGSELAACDRFLSRLIGRLAA